MSGPPYQIGSNYDAIQYILNYKLTKMAEMYGDHFGYALEDSNKKNQDQCCIRPSGPRRAGEGLDDCEQGVLSAGFTDEGVKVMLTQLLAGFLIGPNGSSIRDLMRRIGCQVKSYTQNIIVCKPIRVRVFIVEGREDQVLTCLDVLLAAVDRYKDLAEGSYQGQLVQRIQKIKGYVFYYYPPPKNVVPNAAAIKGSPPSQQTKVAKSILGFQSTGSYLAYLDSICNKIAKPQTSPGLTDFIRASLESPPEDVDDLGSTYPGLFPGKIYTENSSDWNQLEDFDSQVSGLARAVHLKESLEVSSAFNISENIIGNCKKCEIVVSGRDGGSSSSSAAERLSFDNIPPEILYRAESLILSNPEMFTGYPEMEFAAQKKMVVDVILEYLGYPVPVPRSTTVPLNTGVFIKDAPVKKESKGDPVVSAPPMKRGFRLALPKSPQKSPAKFWKGGCNSLGSSPFRRTPFSHLQTSSAANRKPLSPLSSNASNFTNAASQQLPSYLEQGIFVDLKKIVNGSNPEEGN